MHGRSARSGLSRQCATVRKPLTVPGVRLNQVAATEAVATLTTGAVVTEATGWRVYSYDVRSTGLQISFQMVGSITGDSSA